MFGFPDDIVSKLANVAHERVTGELAMFDLAQTKFPFAGQFGTG